LKTGKHPYAPNISGQYAPDAAACQSHNIGDHDYAEDCINYSFFIKVPNKFIFHDRSREFDKIFIRNALDQSSKTVQFLKLF